MSSDVGAGGHRGAARRAGVLHPRRHDTLSTRPTTGALQLRPHRCATRRDHAPWARPMAGRPDCTRRTSTTTPTPSARSTSPATPRSCSDPTGRASAASSARSPSSRADRWKLGQLRARGHRPVRSDPRGRRAVRRWRRHARVRARHSARGGDGDDGVLAGARPTATRGHLPPQRRRQRARRVRRHGARPRPAGARARAAPAAGERASGPSPESSTSPRASARCRSTSTRPCCRSTDCSS